ncbi:MAG: serine/threonine protein kinase, partial [Alphaproteobacteria bacterium]|nr:serine/threonine protein kinase [Alphaproteobacteria bacterium]
MVGEIRPTEPPELSRAADGDPFGALPAHTQIGKYEVIATLGQGGFGITYRARDTQLDREVAIKEYLPTAFARRLGGSTVVPRSTQTAEDFLWGRARFLDEARTLAKLEDAPGIVNVYDFMEANGTAYMVMALVRGETLDARLKRDRRLPQPAIELLLYPLLDGLEIVHAAGFLHRDIKPANILTDTNGRPTLIDFGASRLALQGRTQAMTAIYTPGYAAPEQMTPSAKQGPWTDVYALAGTLYHCVAGTPPISAIERLTGDAMVPAVEVGKGRYGPSLLAAIDAGLTLKAADRPQSVAEWRQVLSGIAADRPQGTPTRELDDPTRPMTDELTRQVARTPRRAPWTWAAAIVVALAAGGGAWMTLRPAPETPAEALRRVEEDARRQTALAAKLRQEEEARQRLAADAARKAEAEAARRAAEEKAAAEAAARRQNEEAERQRAAAEAARRKADEEAARR